MVVKATPKFRHANLYFIVMCIVHALKVEMIKGHAGHTQEIQLIMLGWLVKTLGQFLEPKNRYSTPNIACFYGENRVEPNFKLKIQF